MLILFDNVLKRSTVSSSNESLNYPSENLIDDFLRLRYQCGATSDTIEFALDDSYDISSIFTGYASGITTANVKLYDGVTLKKTIALGTAINDETQAIHFVTEIGIDKITIEITGSIGMYIGGMAAGICYDMGNVLSPFEEKITDRSIVSSSPYGQVQQNYIPPLDSIFFIFRLKPRDERNTIVDEFKAIGNGATIWVDYFEDNHDFKKPQYVTVSSQVAPSKVLREYTVSINLTEAR